MGGWRNGPVMRGGGKIGQGKKQSPYHDPRYDSWHVAMFTAEHVPAWKKLIPAGIYPWIAYLWYLAGPQEYGGVDGSHYLPGLFKGDRLWQNCDRDEMVRSWISVFAVVAWAKLVWIDW